MDVGWTPAALLVLATVVGTWVHLRLGWWRVSGRVASSGGSCVVVCSGGVAGQVVAPRPFVSRLCRVVRVLSVAKLSVGMEAYYESQIAKGMDDYYAGRGESPGIWAGRAAMELGLQGVVGDGELGHVLRGTDPATGSVLRAPARGRTITVESIDPASGELVSERKRLAPVAGFDLVFSAPKSVSVLHALTEEDEVRRAISDAHETAWRAALEYLEQEACVVRRGKGGTQREQGGGFLAAAFRHRTSRAQDPHLHTHVVVANMTPSKDGSKWLSLDGRSILQTHRIAAGYLYETQLRHELTTRLAVSWTEPVKGMAELASMPGPVIDEFSTRRRTLVEHMREHGLNGFHAARLSALTTRETKTETDPGRLRRRWAERAATHGLTAAVIRQLATPDAPEWARSDGPSAHVLVERLLGPHGMTEKHATFTRAELVQAIAAAHRNGVPAREALALADRLLQHPLASELQPHDPDIGDPGRYTTVELLQLEHAALQVARGGASAGAPTAAPGDIDRAIREAPLALTTEQKELVRQAATRPDRVVAVIGAAGSGKTTALRALRIAYHRSGVPVLGCAPTGRAADELHTSTGIASTTMHQLLHQLERGERPPGRCVLVIDEAGMADTRTLTPLLIHLERIKGKAILVGDPHQLPSVGAGGLYHHLCQQLDAIELTDNRRQHDPHERTALTQLRVGDPGPYLYHAVASQRITTYADANDAKAQLLHDWWRTAQHDPTGSIMIAHARRDVHDLNHAARALMLQHNRLGVETLELEGGEFRVGDRVICKRNNTRLGVRNGTRGTISELREGSLTIRTDTGDTRTIPRTYAREHLQHAYATTAHAIQGATLNRAHVLLHARTLTREWAYTAVTRARCATHLYTVDSLLERGPATPTRGQLGAHARLVRSMQRATSDQQPAISRGMAR